MDATDTKIVVAGYNSQKVSRDQSVIRDSQSVSGLGVQHRGGGLQPPEPGAGVPGPHVLHHLPPGPLQAAGHPPVQVHRRHGRGQQAPAPLRQRPPGRAAASEDHA